MSRRSRSCVRPRQYEPLVVHAEFGECLLQRTDRNFQGLDLPQYRKVPGGLHLVIAISISSSIVLRKPTARYVRGIIILQITCR